MSNTLNKVFKKEDSEMANEKQNKLTMSQRDMQLNEQMMATHASQYHHDNIEAAFDIVGANS
jgi:hypothetical protein